MKFKRITVLIGVIYEQVTQWRLVAACSHNCRLA